MMLSKTSRKYFLLLFLTYINEAYSQASEIRIEPRSAVAQDVLASEVFSSVTYLPLEARHESMFGNADQLEVADNYLIILDKSVETSNGTSYGSIFIFDKTGKFHARIPKIHAINFTVDHLAKEIVFNDLGSSMSLNYYDYDGKLLRKERRKFMVTDLAILDNKTKVYYRNFNKPSTTDSLSPQFKFSNVMVEKRGEKMTGYLPYDTAVINNMEVMLLHPRFTRSGSSIYFSEPYRYTIREVTPNQMIDKYKFVFPAEFSLADNFVMSGDHRGKRIQYLRSNYNKYCSIGDFYVTGEMLLFSLYTLAGKEGFIYNTVDGDLLSLSSMTFDGPSPFSRDNGKILFVADRTVYGCLPAATLLSNNSDLKKKLKIASKEVNPLLVLLTLK